MAKKHETSQEKTPQVQKKKRRRKRSFMEVVVEFLFVLTVLFACSVAADYILFAFGKTPVFAATLPKEEHTEHVGLIYVVTQSDEGLSWEWIWNKLLVSSEAA